ncbi:MAG: TAT-variant-translocated molybdopterin oxidoreductase [Phycisphaerales bacterium]
MSQDQCPSSKKEGLPLHSERTAHALVGSAGGSKAYWRGLEDLADTPEFRENLEREFPAGASELLEGSRRTFLKLMGAGLALAGVVSIPGCRRPDHKILPYSKNVPEDIIPGKSLFYATSMPLPGGGAEGLLVETHEGRPTKIEGNPLHPNNQGKSGLWAQASILDMYDPDRLTEPSQVVNGQDAPRTSEDFPKAWAPEHFKQYDATRGAGLAIIVEKKTSPCRDAMEAAVKARFPKATWISYDALENRGAIDGLATAFGRPVREVLDFSKAKLIVSLDRDFTQFEPLSMTYARDFAANRRVAKVEDSISRFYMVEPSFSSTGSLADHRRRMAPAEIEAFIAKVAARVLNKRQVPGSKSLTLAADRLAGNGEVDAFADAVAADLMSADFAGKSIICVGASQPAWVHALVAGLNQALGNVGQTVRYAPLGDGEAQNSAAALADLCKAIDGGQVKTVVTIGCNPVYNAPAELDFAEKFKKVPERIALSTDNNETVAASTWKLNGCHYLEAWGDTQSVEGMIAPIQPMIAPIYGGMSELEMLALIAGYPKAVGYEIVRDVWKKNIAAWMPKSDAGFDTLWSRALHNGVLGVAPTAKPTEMVAGFDKISTGIGAVQVATAPSRQALAVAFRGVAMHDGRWNNNAWLQELPEASSRICWDNVALISPTTAKDLDLHQTAETDKKPKGRVAELKIGDRKMRIACWAVPGVPDNTVVLPLGYGREAVGLVGNGTGFNTFAVRTSKNAWAAGGATLTPVDTGDQWYNISSMQTHWSMEGRAIARQVDVQAWNSTKLHEEIASSNKTRTDSYGRPFPLDFAERLAGTELPHQPSGYGIYANPFDAKRGDGFDPNRASEEPGKSTDKRNAFARRAQWGMTIDLSTCTGCNVCTIACQAENNIAVVGKIEVNKGREMHWIRVDRYFVSSLETADREGRRNDWNDPELAMMYQPVACVHCESAPCETVCPVNATTHGPEGHNFMTYNRCIGTRYCANNCPYKVRRFNFFDYGVTKFNGGLEEPVKEMVGETISNNLPKNHNLIPPRIRKKLDEISRMQKNPNVTVRSRGVMEKCSYCIQRTNEAKIAYKLGKVRAGEQYAFDTDGIPDGYVQTACQQACPTNAIVFGDTLDKDTPYKNGEGAERLGSMVKFWRDNPRAYLLLGYLKTVPRTSHLLRVNNPSKQLLTAINDVDRLKAFDNPFGPHGLGGEHGGDEHAPHVGEKHSFIDSNKRGRDGYVMSLSVLGARA